MTSNRYPTKRTKGFTLMELLVVVMIIGLLVGIVAPRFFSQLGKSEVQAARAQIDALEKALETYRLDMGSFPSSSDGLAALLKPPASSVRWRGPYLKKGIPLDPWGRAYEYRVPGKLQDYEVLSYGKDGKPGGQGDDADISSDGP